VAAGCFYLLAGAAATRMRRDLLGPVRDPAEARADGRAELAAIASALAVVATGLAAGARHVLRRRSPTAVLGVIGASKYLYGILLLMAILLYCNYFYPQSANVALGHFTSLVFIPGAVGYGLAGLVTPSVTERISKQAWIAVALVTAAVLTGALGPSFAQVEFLVVAFGVNLASQSVAISAATILQEDVEDSYRGRVFAFYDMMSNVPFVLGAALSALVMPVNGKSYGIVAAIAAGYLVAAGGYWALARRPAAGYSVEPASGSPASRAQRSSS